MNAQETALPSFGFYASLKEEREAWGKTGAPDFPASLAFYFQRKGPVFKGDAKWHLAFWDSPHVASLPAHVQLSCAALVLLISGSSKGALEAALAAAAKHKGAADPKTLPQSIGAELLRLLPEWDSAWSLSGCAKRVCWGSQAFPDAATAKAIQSDFIAKMSALAKEFAAVDNLAAIACSQFEQSLRSIRNGTPQNHSAIPYWVRFLDALGIEQDCPPETLCRLAALACSCGGKKIHDSFFALLRGFPAAAEQFDRACRTLIARAARPADFPEENQDPAFDGLPLNVPRLCVHLSKIFHKSRAAYAQRPDLPGLLQNLCLLSSTHSLPFKLALQLCAERLSLGLAPPAMPDACWLGFAHGHAALGGDPGRHKLVRSLLPEPLRGCPAMNEALSKLAPNQISSLEQNDLSELLASLLSERFEEDGETPQKPKLRL